MTAPHEWNPVPNSLAVRCPECGEEAEFDFAAVARIERLSDVLHFENHQQLLYSKFSDRRRHSWHGAVFFPGLKGRDWTSIRNLPEGYAAELWNPANQPARLLDLILQNPSSGCVHCQYCQIARRHDLKWPKEAWYQIGCGNDVLWAWHRKCAEGLRDFIASKDRDPHKHDWYLFLLHIPEVFLQAKTRAEVLKKLDRILK